MLTVKIKDTNIEEKKYILNILLSDFLGIEYSLEFHNEPFMNIEKDRKKIEISDVFLRHEFDKDWLTRQNFPKLPLSVLKKTSIGLDIDRVEDEIPILFGNPSVDINDDFISVGIDFFGGAFFLLTRYEEAVSKERDLHDRFSAVSSIAQQSGAIMRPIVNEYLEILWSIMLHLWPDLIRKQRTFRTLVSCDVDHINHRPSNYFTPFIKNLAKNILKDNSLHAAFLTITRFIRVGLLKIKKIDPYNTFDFSMDVCESNNIKQAFYFIADHTAGDIDGYYEIDGADARELLNTISKRGHEIGIHLSYNAYNQHSQSIKEMTRLRKVLKEEGIDTDIIGGRNHYLRWDSLTSPLIWEKIGATYDSTLGFADIIGFRSSTCYEYPLYDLKNRTPLNVIERPLLIMDTTLLLEKYMGMPYAESLIAATDIKNICKKFEGDFTFLWHNSSFLTDENKRLFTKIIED